MLAGISLFDPLGGLGQDVASWFGHSISAGIGNFAAWAINGVAHAMQATTTPDFTSWFAGPWRAMLSVVAWLSVPILFVGVGAAALRGDLTSVLKRGLGAPVIMAIGGNQGFGQGLSLLSDFALSATVASGGSALPGLAAALIVALAGLAALVIWFVRALRGALLYLEVLAIPLALCGMYWGGTAHWIKRLVDLIVATILSQLVITMLMVLAAADLNSGHLSGSGSATSSGTGSVGADMTTLFLSVAFLLLGSLALPMALKHVPSATEHAAAAASQISAPGRMTNMGSRVADTAKMMGHSGGGDQAIVRQAGMAAGPVGMAASAGIGAAAMAARVGVDAAVGASAGSSGAAGPAASGSSAGGGPVAPGSTGSAGGTSGPGPAGGRGVGGGAAGQAGGSSSGTGASPGRPPSPSTESPAGAGESTAVRGVAARGTAVRNCPGGSHC